MYSLTTNWQNKILTQRHKGTEKIRISPCLCVFEMNISFAYHFVFLFKNIFSCISSLCLCVSVFNFHPRASVSLCLLFFFSSAYADTLTISKDRNSQYTSIQQAFDNLPCNNVGEMVIVIKKGIYDEKICLYPTRSKIRIIGESCDSSIIEFDDYSGKILNNDTLTTHNSYTFRIMSDNVSVENITISNTTILPVQAVAIEVKSDKVAFRNCRFLGNQDTFYANSDGRIYVSNCYIEGTTDFIFGKSIVLFDSCTIHSKKDSYITAASTPENVHYGFVFKDCKLSAESNISKVYLGRPWRSFARTVFLNCELGNHILPEGWNNWNKPEREKSVYYAEYHSTGQGANTINRVKWSFQLTDLEANKYMPENIFSKKASNINFPDNWKPEF